MMRLISTWMGLLIGIGPVFSGTLNQLIWYSNELSFTPDGQPDLLTPGGDPIPASSNWFYQMYIEDGDLAANPFIPENLALNPGGTDLAVPGAGFDNLNEAGDGIFGKVVLDYGALGVGGETVYTVIFNAPTIASATRWAIAGESVVSLPDLLPGYPEWSRIIFYDVGTMEMIDWQARRYYLDICPPAGVTNQGSVNPDSGWYANSNLVELTATPATYHTFSHWSGDLSGSSNPASLFINNSNQSVVAHFALTLLTNGLPQIWLAQHGLGTNDAAALADFDGDGMANWAEFFAGTQPTNANSVLRLEIESMGADVFVCRWDSANFDFSYFGAFTNVYTIQCRTNLYDGVSMPLVSNLFATPPTNSYVLTNRNAKAFYHVELLLQL